MSTLLGALELRWTPALGMGLAAVLILAAMAASGWGARRRGGGRGWWAAGLRALALVVIGAILLGPERLIPAADSDEKPTVVLMIDRSASMGVEDESVSGAPATRLGAICARWLDPSFLAELDSVSQTRLLAFDERVEATGLETLLSGGAQGGQSRIGRAVDATLGAARAGRGAKVTDIVVLSDGVDTDGAVLGASAGGAIASGVRVHGVSAGSEQRLADLAVHVAPASDLVYEGQGTTLRVRVRETGFEGQPVRVIVRREGIGAGDAGEVVFDESVAVRGRREIEVPVTPAVDPGARSDARSEVSGGVDVVEYTARVEAMPGEKNTENNERRAFVRVTSDRLKVCVFENEPYWDTRFFIEAMRDDPQVEVTSVQGLGFERGRPRMHVVRYVPDAVSSREERVAAPLDEASLFRFDVIVLGRGVEAFFPDEQAEKLVRFVTDRGGALVFLRGGAARGRAGEILDQIAPVVWGRRVLAGHGLEVTPEGMAQPALTFEKYGDAGDVVTELPGMIATTSVEDEKALSVVWLRQREGRGAEDAAAVAHMHAGRGRTMAVMTDGLWRWGFLPAALEEYSSVYQMFWSRAVRWLVMGGDFLPGQDVALTTDRVTARPGQTIRVQVRARYAAEGFEPGVRLIGPGGEEEEVVMSADRARGGERFGGAFAPEREGVYRVELRAPGMKPDVLSTRLAVYEDRVEFDDTAARPGELASLAKATGGSMFEIARPRDLLEVIQGEVAARKSRVTREPAWDTWWVFGALVTVLCVEWFWRRRGGLP